MKLLICTPAYGGMVTTGYLRSLIPTISHLQSQGIEVTLHGPEGESLISRGRNTCAQFLIERDMDKLLFIDSDIVFTPEKVQMLIDSEAELVGGTYPIKAHPITLNFNPLQHQRDLFGDIREQDNYIEWVKKYADPKTGEAEVEHLPTGFMLIDRNVFAKLSYKVPWYQTFHPETRARNQYFEFFPVGVNGHQYESEDWAFCRLAREEGVRVMLQTKAVCAHVGTHYYGLGQHIVVGQEPLIPGGKR